MLGVLRARLLKRASALCLRSSMHQHLAGRSIDAAATEPLLGNEKKSWQSKMPHDTDQTQERASGDFPSRACDLTPCNALAVADKVSSKLDMGKTQQRRAKDATDDRASRLQGPTSGKHSEGVPRRCGCWGACDRDRHTFVQRRCGGSVSCKLMSGYGEVIELTIAIGWGPQTMLWSEGKDHRL